MIAPATCPYIYTPTTRRLRTVKWRGAPMRLANVCVALSLAVSAAGCSSTSVANVPQDAKAVPQGWIQEVNPATFAGAASISDRAWKATLASNGKNYAVPFSAQSFAVFVRADWRARLHLPEPKSWNDLAAMARAFTNNDPDGNGRKDTYGLVVPGTTKRGYMSWYFSTYLWANGGDFLASDGQGRWQPAINNDKSVQAVAWLKDMFCRDKVVNPDAVSIDTPRAHDTFEKGIGGISLTGPYMLSRFVKSMGGDKIEVFPVPPGPAGGPGGALAEGENVYLMAGSRN